MIVDPSSISDYEADKMKGKTTVLLEKNAIIIKIITLSGSSFRFKVWKSFLVGDLKEMAVYRLQSTKQEMRLIFAGRELENEKRLQD